MSKKISTDNKIDTKVDVKHPSLEELTEMIEVLYFRCRFMFVKKDVRLYK